MYLKFLILTVFCFLMTGTAGATTYWVAATGGTASTTCTSIDGTGDPGVYARTIATAVSCMVGGDTVIIKAGTYATDFDQDTPQTGAGIVLPSGISDLQRTIIKANGTDVVVIDCVNRGFDSADDHCIHLINKSNITFDGLTLDCSGIAGPCFQTNGTTNITLQNSRHLDSNDSSPGNTGSGTVNVNNRFINNEFRGTGTNSNNPLGGDHTIYLSRCDNCLIERNWFHGAGRVGIQLHFETATSAMQNPVVRYNLIEDSAANCMAITTVVNLEVYGNICRNNGEAGNTLQSSRAAITLGGHRSPYSAKIYNNTIYANGVKSGSTTACIQVASGFTATIRNNLCLDNTSGGVSQNGIGVDTANPGILIASNNISTIDDNLVVDAPNGRFSPREGSSLINGGVSTGLPVGFTCVSTCDQGAFEAPVFNSALIADGDNAKIRSTFTVPTQSIRNGVGLVGGLFSHFAVTVAGGASVENLLAFTQTVRADVSIGTAVTNGQVVTINYTRSSTNTLTDNLCIGGTYGICKNAEIRSTGVQSVVNNVAIGGGTPVLSVTHFQCLNIYSTTTSVETRGVQDADCSGRPGGYFAMAVLITGTIADPGVVTLTTYFNRDNGSYTPLTNAINFLQPGFGKHPESGFADGQSVAVAILTNPVATFVPGAVVGQEQSAPTIDLVQNSSTTMIIIGRIDPNTVVGSRFCFQPRRHDGTVLTYTVTPCLTVVNPGTGIY
jgi:hypothetical protein